MYNARRVGLHRRVDELPELGEVHDFVEALTDFPLRQAEHDAVEEILLAPGDFRVKADAKLDGRRNAAFGADGAARELGDAGHELERHTLTRPVPADRGVGGYLGHAERNIF